MIWWVYSTSFDSFGLNSNGLRLNGITRCGWPWKELLLCLQFELKTLQPTKKRLKALGIPFSSIMMSMAALGERDGAVITNQTSSLWHRVQVLVVMSQKVNSFAALQQQVSHINVDRQPTYGLQERPPETAASSTGIIAPLVMPMNTKACSLARLIDNGEEVTAKTVFDLAKRRRRPMIV